MHSMELESKAPVPKAEGKSSFARQNQKSAFDALKVDTHAATTSQASPVESLKPQRHVKHTVDLGAQIITGFDNGNPMEIIVRRQLSNLGLHYLVNESCDLFGQDGKLVSKTLDQHCEAVFNHILDEACQLRKDKELPIHLRAYLRERLMRGGSDPGRVKTAALPTLGHCMDFFIESHPEFTSWTTRELDLIHWHYANLEVLFAFMIPSHGGTLLMKTTYPALKPSSAHTSCLVCKRDSARPTLVAPLGSR